jgi:hypothetical protein
MGTIIRLYIVKHELQRKYNSISFYKLAHIAMLGGSFSMF